MKDKLKLRLLITEVPPFSIWKGEWRTFKELQVFDDEEGWINIPTEYKFLNKSSTI